MTVRIFALVCAALVAITTTIPSLAEAQPTTPRASASPSTPATPGVGLDLFGGAGVTFPAAKDSFEALQLSSTPIDLGGGARVTRLWRGLFAQASASRWTGSGERAFVASDGSIFPLGIPLDVKATFVDATVGVKNATQRQRGRTSVVAYAGAGAGFVRYEESSPFAQPGDDLKTTKPTYHGLIGIEIPVRSRLAVAVEGKYRYVPGVLGEGGVSSVLEEDSLGGFQTSVGLRYGFGSTGLVTPRRTPAPAPAEKPLPVPPVERRGLAEGIIAQTAPVYLVPDAKRTPLRTLPAGTLVRIMEETGDWTRVEFSDPQYGRRVGWVQTSVVAKQDD